MLTISPDYHSTGTASLRVSRNLLNQLNTYVGQWVDVENGSRRYTCRIWPSRSLPDHVVQVDTLITTSVTPAPIDMSKCTIVSIPSPRPAVHVIVSVELQNESEELQKQDIGFLFKSATEEAKLNAVRNALNGLSVCTGCVVAGPVSRFCLSISIISTIPFTHHVQITPATRITLHIPSQSDLANSVASSLASLSLDAIKRSGAPSLPGLESAYDALLEVVSYPLVYPDLIRALGIECPKGVLLYGPPGVGKTFLVSSIAQACNAKLVTIHGPEVYSPYIGESEEKLRSKFDQAKALAVEEMVSVILFIDELDSLTPHRATAQPHESRVVAQLLTLMDGVTSRGRVVVVAATNRQNAIDPALRRPGRFDREIAIDPPSELTRLRILSSQTRTMPLADDVDMGKSSLLPLLYHSRCLTAFIHQQPSRPRPRDEWLRGRGSGGTMPRGGYGRRASECNGRGWVRPGYCFLHACCFLTVDRVVMRDFQLAMARVGPSIQRGVQVEVEMTRWEDVGGLDDKLRQAVEWPIKHRATFERLGLRPPRGILLYGPPGCSKTTLVKVGGWRYMVNDPISQVIASTSGASFLSVNSAQLYSPYVGDSEKIIRSTFQKARSAFPSVIFFDEIDAIVGKRNLGYGGGSGDNVQERVLSMLLNEMDGVESATSVLVVGATNRPDMLDAALLRPGRFDRLVYVPPPDFTARLQILQIHTRNTPLSEDVDLEALAGQTDMYTGADIENLCREAAIITLRAMREAACVEMRHFADALLVVRPSLTREMLRQYEVMHEKY
ncbi:cell division control protein 48, AAA family [Jimgerdemannia flammicorona]|uniref:Cell division control protein 48, AAA family n=1 Tax=Jimgerdemannia flammicorona TaxID=994334 RepID=A0A433D7Q0_9FUNG|nr:cell division control protein 48, AAA family [Jimgerdemannia flammicorona]